VQPPIRCWILCKHRIGVYKSHHGIDLYSSLLSVSVRFSTSLLQSQHGSKVLARSASGENGAWSKCGIIDTSRVLKSSRFSPVEVREYANRPKYTRPPYTCTQHNTHSTQYTEHWLSHCIIFLLSSINIV
jgi:hypothetical protein